MFPLFPKIDEGISFAKKVVAMGDEQEMSSRGYLALGIGYSLKACEGIVLRALSSLEWFSIECCKTKTKAVTSANHNRPKQCNEPIRTCNRRKWNVTAVKRGLGFAFHWLKKWREFCWPITERSNTNQNKRNLLCRRCSNTLCSSAFTLL